MDNSGKKKLGSGGHQIPWGFLRNVSGESEKSIVSTGLFLALYSYSLHLCHSFLCLFHFFSFLVPVPLLPRSFVKRVISGLYFQMYCLLSYSLQTNKNILYLLCPKEVKCCRTEATAASLKYSFDDKGGLLNCVFICYFTEKIK